MSLKQDYSVKKKSEGVSKDSPKNSSKASKESGSTNKGRSTIYDEAAARDSFYYFKRIINSVVCWFDSEAGAVGLSDSKEFNWFRVFPFLLLHVSVLGVIWVGWSPFAVAFAVAFYFFRMFAITGIYHRYFSHKTYSLNRFWQFVFAFWGALCCQRGALWWAAHHRHHHKYSDTEDDIHSPVQRGFWWSHMGWFTADVSFKTPFEYIKDFAKYPELRFLNRYDILVPVLCGAAIFYLGVFLEAFAPSLGTNGGQLLVWGMFISTVCLFHGTVTINSLSHIFGKKRFDTSDNSRNNVWLAFITMGEGWHNNHHRYPATARQGFYWWEIDATYYVLKFFSFLGIVKNLKPVPASIYKEVEDLEKERERKKKRALIMSQQKKNWQKNKVKQKSRKEEVVS